MSLGSFGFRSRAPRLRLPQRRQQGMCQDATPAHPRATSFDGHNLDLGRNCRDRSLAECRNLVKPSSSETAITPAGATSKVLAFVTDLALRWINLRANDLRWADP